jgi:hypothetical protein
MRQVYARRMMFYEGVSGCDSRIATSQKRDGPVTLPGTVEFLRKASGRSSFAVKNDIVGARATGWSAFG